MALMDLTGQKFGRLTVIERDNSKPKGHGKPVYWICQCDCGKIKSVKACHLKDGSIQSCGCLHKEIISNIMTEDLTGKKFGRLLVLTKTNKSNKRGIIWLCKCDCGNLKEVNSADLKSKSTQSCGCLVKENIEKLHQANRKYKDIDLTGMRSGKLTALTKINDNIWLCKCDCGNLKEVSYLHFIHQEVLSCGCLRSKGEEKINKILTEEKINFITQFSFENLKDKKLLYFDFAIFKNQSLFCLIEYQGEQHFLNQPRGYFTEEKIQNIKYKDFLKKEYCLNNNIPLYEISYLDYEKLNWDFIKNLINYEKER